MNESTRHTSGANLDLFHRAAVQDGAGLENLELVLASVGNDGLDLSVAGALELDVERGGSLARGG